MQLLIHLRLDGNAIDIIIIYIISSCAYFIYHYYNVWPSMNCQHLRLIKFRCWHE